MTEYREWGSTSEWTRIDQLSAGVTHLSEGDMCWFMYDYIADSNDDIPSWDRSDATKWILNFKKSMKKVRECKRQAAYKAEAKGYFIRDLSSFFEKVTLSIYGVGVTPSEIALIPMPPSKSPDDPDYDDRMVQAVEGCAEKSSVLAAPVLQIFASVTPAHQGGSRDVNVLRKNYRFAGRLPESVKIAFIVDDIITTGSHFRAAREVLQEAFPEVNIGGLFWGKSRYLNP